MSGEMEVRRQHNDVRDHVDARDRRFHQRATAQFLHLTTMLARVLLLVATCLIFHGILGLTLVLVQY